VRRHGQGGRHGGTCALQRTRQTPFQTSRRKRSDAVARTMNKRFFRIDAVQREPHPATLSEIRFTEIV